MMINANQLKNYMDVCIHGWMMDGTRIFLDFDEILLGITFQQTSRDGKITQLVAAPPVEILMTLSLGQIAVPSPYPQICG